uniref:Uncharacterized protein n=1 Tax=Vespula pensylvanica TaxID=30213 RepID=A0A834NXY1_VESPE|nr:hypothetical protein H0235_010937 [Vespula pensylvanica]
MKGPNIQIMNYRWLIVVCSFGTRPTSRNVGTSCISTNKRVDEDDDDEDDDDDNSDDDNNDDDYDDNDDDDNNNNDDELDVTMGTVRFYVTSLFDAISRGHK